MSVVFNETMLLTAGKGLSQAVGYFRCRILKWNNAVNISYFTRISEGNDYGPARNQFDYTYAC